MTWWPPEPFNHVFGPFDPVASPELASNGLHKLGAGCASDTGTFRLAENVAIKNDLGEVYRVALICRYNFPLKKVTGLFLQNGWNYLAYMPPFDPAILKAQREQAACAGRTAATIQEENSALDAAAREAAAKVQAEIQARAQVLEQAEKQSRLDEAIQKARDAANLECAKYNNTSACYAAARQIH